MPARPRHAPARTLPQSTFILRAPLLARRPWLVHGFSTRVGGVSRLPDPNSPRGELNLGHLAWDPPSNVAENRRRLVECLQARDMTLVVQNQIHSDLIRVIDRAPAPSRSWRGDGLMTDRPGLLLAILAADCLPVLLTDVRQRVVAALHCGWRGTARRIAQKAVGHMRQQFASRPEDLRAAIGPGIRVCCYRIGEEVAAEYESQFLYAANILTVQKPHKKFVDKKYALMRSERWRGTPSRDGRIIHLDLVEANLRQLEAAGLERRHIYADSPCTSCNPALFFSHRRDAGRTGRMMGVIGIRK